MKFLIPRIALSLTGGSCFSGETPQCKETQVVHAATTIDEHNQFDPIWLAPDDRKALSKVTKIATETLSAVCCTLYAVHSNATYYQITFEPAMYRINRRNDDKGLLKSVYF